MSRTSPSNVAASVRQRLLNRARTEGEDFQTLLTRYVLERLLYRLSRSPYRDRFVVKGAMLFLLWEGRFHRMTRDLDLLSFGPSEVERVEQRVRDICATRVEEEDGIVFRLDTVRSHLIREDQIYEGVRVSFEAYLGSARIPLQVDVGFGDAITPAPQEARFPALLGFPAPSCKSIRGRRSSRRSSRRWRS